MLFCNKFVLSSDAAIHFVHISRRIRPHRSSFAASCRVARHRPDFKHLYYIQVPSVYAFFRCIFTCAHYYVTFRLLNVEILQVFRAAYCPSRFSCIFCIVAYPGNLPWLCDALQEQSRFSSEAGTGHPATVSATTVSFCRALLTRPWWGSLVVSPWVLFFIGPQRGTAGVSVWVLILGCLLSRRYGSGHIYTQRGGAADRPWLVTLISWGISAILCQTK